MLKPRNAGKAGPRFSLPSTGSRTPLHLSSLRGSKVVLYFAASYPAFKQKMKFPFELLCDPEEAVCKQFGVMKLKNLYGKQVRGIERSTFVVDEQGLLAREWRGVKVTGHVQEVLNFAQAL